MHQGEIDLLHGAASELFGQSAVGGIVFGHQEDAAGEAVQAMHDTGPKFAAGRGERSEAVQQSVDEGSGVNSGSGVHHHAGGLVDGREIVILIQDLERDIFRDSLEGALPGGLNGDLFTPAEEMGRAPGLAVDPHAADLDPFLQARPAELGEALLQDMVEAPAAVLSINGKEQHASVF
jgi:hypothetical protein